MGLLECVQSVEAEGGKEEEGGEAHADGMVRFWVRDNGAGLRPEQQAQLFKPFTQLAQARATGYGLGLSIVQRIAEKLGGQVGVESSGAPGQGCTFSFTLPATRPVMRQTDLTISEPTQAEEGN